jgi:hypothetical protein
MGAPLLKAAEQWDRTSVTLPKRVWDRLAASLETFNGPRPKPERYSRDRYMAELLDWACDEMEREKSERSSAGKAR